MQYGTCSADRHLQVLPNLVVETEDVVRERQTLLEAHVNHGADLHQETLTQENSRLNDENNSVLRSLN